MRIICLILVFLIMMSSGLLSETLPTKGVFKEVYYKDHFGIGRFGFCLVIDKTLQEQLEKYDGKYIEIEVLAGRQPTNPGPVIVDKIGNIKLLPQPLVISVTRETTVQENTPFQIFSSLKNAGKSDIEINPRYITATIREYGKFDYLNKKGIFSSIGNTRFLTGDAIKDTELSVGEVQFPFRSLIGGELNVPTAILGNPSEGPGSYLLKPDSTMPFTLVLSKGLPEGKYEVEFTVIATVSIVKSWLVINSVKEKFEQKSKPSELTLSYCKINDDDPWIKSTYGNISDTEKASSSEWIGLSLILKNISKKERFIPASSDSGGMLCVGHLIGYTTSGKMVGLVFKYRHPPSKHWSLVKIPQEGHTIKFHFRHPSYFPEELIVKLTCQILTDQGLESFVIEPEYKDPFFVKSPDPGPATNGVTCRIRTDKTVYKVGEQIRFYAQFTNISGKPICWWKPDSDLGENIEVLIDDRGITLPNNKAEYISGWAAQWRCAIPEESVICLPNSLNLAPGKHSLIYKIISKAGTYRNANNENISLLDGILISNTVQFTVKD